MHADIITAHKDGQNVLHSAGGWIKSHSETSTVVNWIVRYIHCSPPSCHGRQSCWRSCRHAETPIDCKLMGVRADADADPDIPAPYAPCHRRSPASY